MNGNGKNYLQVRTTQALVGRITGQPIAAGTVGRVIDVVNGILIVDFNSRLSVARFTPDSDQIEVMGANGHES